ncbi:efflux RND transporter permease subunit [Umboniibacter marinipuniceus]|uniref:Hydrophobe/amphiphile efflux-1 (HAE1) family protein n=1 Tax=Umboniibacter marinipuniceus TaxID=569599 RepID=A0A3M0A513_9GAMM|nr:efflux RND transporter permease subunit [Umboniibacter marinipuniceus]RMA79474.1 hydrophobe/amphiphile efflux-1 (HAE1) family protein [Umboniibacter marinipuniceus]
MTDLNHQRTNDIASLSVRRPVLVTVLNLLIMVAGFAALFGVEVRELPDIDRPVVTVRAVLPGASPETVDAEVTSHLEAAATRVSGVKNIRSQSEENTTRIVIEFQPTVNLDAAASEVREAVSRARRQLPDAVENVSVIKADSDADPVVNLAVASDSLSREALTRRVETDIAPRLISIDGVADVQLRGDSEQVLIVSIDPLRLSSFGISILDVRSALRGAPFDIPAGSFRSLDQQLIIRADATADDAKLVEEIVIRDATRIGDVANVYFGPADAESIVRLDGKAVIGVGVIRQARSNTINISDKVLALAEALDQQYPDLEIRVTSDEALFIRQSVSEVVSTLLLTVVMVVFTLWLFIGSFRTTIVPALSIPVALVGSVAIIWLLGFSINILTLLALVLATGLIVDDAIVVVENIQRHRALGQGRRAAAVFGSREVFFAVVATTAVLASVFLPIAFMPSTAGRLFREFGAVLACAVIISSIVALTLVPAFAAKLPLRTATNDGAPTKREQLGATLKNFYSRSLDTCLRHRFKVLLLSIVAAGAAASSYFTIDNELLPVEDRGVIRAFATGPDGVGLNFMNRQAEQMEAILQPYVDNGQIDSLFTVVGQWDPNRVLITAPLKPWGERDYSQQELIAELSGPLGSIPGAPARVWSSNSLNLRGQGGGLEFAITGEDHPSIYEQTRLLVDALEEQLPNLSDIRIEYQATQPQVRLKIDRQRASSLGVPLTAIATTLRVAVNGDDVVDLNVGDQSIPIILRSSRSAVNSPSDLNNLYVASNTGAMIPMSSLTTFVEEGVAAELERHAQRRGIRVRLGLDELTMQQMMDIVSDTAASVLPSEYGLVFLGEAATLEETSNEVALTYALALLVVFLVLAAQFESVNSAVVVMLTVPFGIAAAVLSLYLTNTSFNIYSQIGLVMLIGLIAKNAILIVEFADQLRDRGYAVAEAVREAAAVRLRPIMMTLLSTILGALPLILSTGAGAEARNAIGWVVFGGLAMAAVFTLYVTPIFYSYIAPLAKSRSNEAQALQSELSKGPRS